MLRSQRCSFGVHIDTLPYKRNRWHMRGFAYAIIDSIHLFAVAYLKYILTLQWTLMGPCDYIQWDLSACNQQLCNSMQKSITLPPECTLTNSKQIEQKYSLVRVWLMVKFILFFFLLHNHRSDSYMVAFFCNWKPFATSRQQYRRRAIMMRIKGTNLYKAHNRSCVRQQRKMHLHT